MILTCNPQIINRILSNVHHSYIISFEAFRLLVILYTIIKFTPFFNLSVVSTLTVLI